MRSNLLLFCLLTTTRVLAQQELARINDPDGFVNVRSNPDTNSEVLTRLNSEQFFYCEPSSDDWWKVRNFDDINGFIHKSRILLIKDLADSVQQQVILAVLNTFKDKVRAYQSTLLLYKEQESAKRLRELETYENEYYTPLLGFLSKQFCKNKNTDLLDRFLNIMIINEMSANESPAWTLGDCYLCNPDLVMQHIDRFSNKDRMLLRDNLIFGFENVTWQKESNIKDYKSLKDKLNSWKK